MELHVLLESVHTADWVVNMAFQATVILLISQIARRLCVKCSVPTRSDLCFITMLLLLVLPFGSFVSISVNGTKIQLMPLTERSWNTGNTSQDTGDTSLGPVDATFWNTSATPSESPLPDAGHTTAKQKQDVSGAFRPPHAPLFEIRLIHGINLFGVIWFIGTLVMLIRLGHGLTYARTIRSELTRLESPAYYRRVKRIALSHKPAMWRKEGCCCLAYYCITRDPSLQQDAVATLNRISREDPDPSVRQTALNLIPYVLGQKSWPELSPRTTRD